MSSPLHLASFKPGSGGDDKDPYIIHCWHCTKKFTVMIGLSNMHYTIFKCPHCEIDCEIE